MSKFDPLNTNIDELFSLSFVEFARRVADRAHRGQAQALQLALMDHLRDLERAVPSDKNNAEVKWVNEQYKTILGLGVLIATSQGSITQQREVLDGTLLDVVADGSRFSRWTKDLALCELCYVDQFLMEATKAADGGVNLRQYLADQVRPKLIERAWCPPIHDYLAAMGKITSRAEEIKDGPTVFFIGSVKGGVGKSLTSAALLYELGKTSSCALIDLDVSGPTAQYHFNVPAIASALSALPDGRAPKTFRSGDGWQYPSSYDVFADSRGSFERRKATVKNCIYPVLKKTKRKRAIVPLPDSPTFCGLIEHLWHGAAGQSDAVIAIDSMIEAVSDEGYANIVLDIGPGLSGVHSQLLRWITNKYRTHGVIVSSPRVADLVGSLYEASWMAARGEYRWQGPLVHLVNGWLYGSAQYKTKLAEWVNGAIDVSLRASTRQRWRTTDSSTQLIAFRLWSVLYLLAVPKDYEKTRLITGELPFDPDLRDVLSFYSTYPDWKGPDLSALMDPNREWTRKLLEHLSLAPTGSES